MTTKITIETIREAAATIIAAASLPEPKTLEQVYADPAYSTAIVYYITVEDPSAILCDQLSEETLAKLCKLRSSLRSDVVSPDYAYDDVSLFALQRVACELSEQFENLVFAVSSDSHEHGNPDEEIGGELIDGYFNGKDYYDVVETDVK